MEVAPWAIMQVNPASVDPMPAMRDAVAACSSRTVSREPALRQRMAIARRPSPGCVSGPGVGIGEHDAADYLALPNVPCVGGSWMVNKEWLDAGDWAAVTASARRSMGG